ncbi:MAG: hypothetical protein CSA81_11875 [Acidobacteria bacterium]|nr:MAG: hypothetical protein CSA81_11875 [Acidobacteriota bacterium]
MSDRETVRKHEPNPNDSATAALKNCVKSQKDGEIFTTFKNSVKQSLCVAGTNKAKALNSLAFAVLLCFPMFSLKKKCQLCYIAFVIHFF